MIRTIDFERILPIWKTELWSNRKSPIETHSAMMITPETFDVGNFLLPVWFHGIFVNDALVGVNSGHMCTDGFVRSRGLWVSANHRGKGYGRILLQTTVDVARQRNVSIVWSFPRKTSWNTYSSAGFILASEWGESETSESNAYCYMKL